MHGLKDYHSMTFFSNCGNVAASSFDSIVEHVRKRYANQGLWPSEEELRRVAAQDVLEGFDNRQDALDAIGNRPGSDFGGYTYEGYEYSVEAMRTAVER